MTTKTTTYAVKNAKNTQLIDATYGTFKTLRRAIKLCAKLNLKYGCVYARVEEVR